MRSSRPNSLWFDLKKIVIVFPFVDENYYREFRKQLDLALNESKVEKLEIIVLLPVNVKKEELPPHRLIHFISPKDYTLFGKLKGDLLYSVTSKEHDALICFLCEDPKLMKVLSSMKVGFRIGINSPVGSYDIDLKGKEMDPQELVSFAKETLEQLSV